MWDDVNTTVFNAIHRGATVYGLSIDDGQTLVTVDTRHGWVMTDDEMLFNPEKLNRERNWIFSTDCVGDKNCRLELQNVASIYPGSKKAIFHTCDGVKIYANLEYLEEAADIDGRYESLLDDLYEYYCAGEREPIYVCIRDKDESKIIGVVMPVKKASV